MRMKGKPETPERHKNQSLRAQSGLDGFLIVIVASLLDRFRQIRVEANDNGTTMAFCWLPSCVSSVSIWRCNCSLMAFWAAS